MDKKAFPTFLISSRDTDLAESIAFTRQAEEYGFGAHDEVNHSVELINRWQGFIHSIMRRLENAYSAKASLALLDDYDILAFKRYCYIAGKLKILSKDELPWAYHHINAHHFFSILMSDSSELLQYLMTHRDEVVNMHRPYNRKVPAPFFNANTLLAISGEFDLLKERALTFLNDEKKRKYTKIRIPDHQFYVGLAEGNIEKMCSALSILLEPKNAKRAVYETAVHFEYYLQLQVLMYAKIAMIHGFDLGIDSPIAPRELIEINPLDKYEDPHDFMKEFDYNKPHQAWVEMWKARMDEYDRRQEAEKNRPFWKKLFG